MKKKLIKPFFWVNILVAIITLLSYLSPFTDPDGIGVISILGLLYPFLLIINLIFIMFWFLVKTKYLFISVLCLIAGFAHFKSFVGFHPSEIINSNTQLSVVTYNIQNSHYILGADKENREERTEDFEGLLKKIGKIDVFCAQEVGTRSVKLFGEKLGLKHTYSPSDYGPVIFSNYPIVDKGEFTFENRVNKCIWTDIAVFDDTIRVYNAHLQSNRITNTANQLIKEGDIQKRETWSNVKNMIGKYKGSAMLRIKQAAVIKKHMKSVDRPILLCGDFNDTPVSRLYKVISEDLSDSFMVKGRGIGTTFAGSIPMLRIDYIFSNAKIQALDHTTFSHPFSDHFPVKSILEIK